MFLALDKKQVQLARPSTASPALPSSMLYINLLCHPSSLVGESGCHLVEPRARLAARRLGPPLVKSIIHDARPVVLSIISGHFRCWFVPDLFFKVGKNLGIDSLGACHGDYFYCD